MLQDGETFRTGMRTIPGVNNFEWEVICNTSLQTRVSRKGYKDIVGIEIVNKDETDIGKFTFSVFMDKLPIPVIKRCNYQTQYSGNDPEFYFYHDDIFNHCESDDFVIIATVNYKLPSFCKLTSGDGDDVIQLFPIDLVKASDDDVSDLEIVVGDRKLKAHKGFLSMISPVFNAMFTHTTKEAQTGVVTIKDFDHATVKAAIDLLYGQPFEPQSIQDVIGILRFAEKYIIKGATDRLETWLIDHLTVDDFGAVIKHAWDHNSDKLKNICGQFYYDNLEFTLSPGFRQLDAGIAKELADYAANQATGDVDQLHVD
uniref:BTB domain-containing protein n=1 Tax=Panagrellus redivivus TaxID=6233 RepID=A0A7E4UMW2_PANRE